MLVISRCLNVSRDSEAVTCEGKFFLIHAPATGKAQRPIQSNSIFITKCSCQNATETYENFKKKYLKWSYEEVG